MIGKVILEVILWLLCALAVFVIGVCVFDFVIETPKQLKRIADALEKALKAGDSK